MIDWILRRRISAEANERLPPIKGQLTSTFLSLPSTKGNVSEKAASASATAGPTPMTRFRMTNKGGEPEAKNRNTEVQDNEESLIIPETSR